MKKITLLNVSTLCLMSLLAGCSRMPSSPSGTSISPVSAPNTSNKMALRIYDKLPTYADAAKMPWQPIEKNDPQAYTIAGARLAAMHISPQPSIKHAISEFQRLNELKVTGTLDQETVNALNITPAQRYQELVTSMHQWEKYPQDANSRYIQVNIPSYDMRLISNGQDVLNMKAIVGRPDRATPLLTSKVSTIVFNPTWTVPKTILSQDVIPGMQKNPHYMKEHYDMRIYKSYNKDAPEVSPSSIDWQNANLSNFNYRVTAPPSDTNPLGRVKFIFDNDQDIYMHDTPEKWVFGLNDRARSSGCIRLENPMALVEYFYADNTDLNAALVNEYLSSGKTKFIQLRNAMPVYITYIQDWVDPNGQVHFGKNVYGR